MKDSVIAKIHLLHNNMTHYFFVSGQLSRCRDPQLQVAENYSYLFALRSNI